MAKQRILESNSNPDRRDHIVAEFNHGGQRREDISASLGFANSRAMYNALVAQGWVTQEKRNTDGDNSNKETKPRKPRGVLPKEIEEWVKRGLVAQFVRDGGDEDDYVYPEITPEFFLAYRPVRDETEAFVVKALGRIGGLDSEAGKSLRQWAGRPLTKAQETAEAAERESAACAAMMPKIARLLEKARALAEQAGLPIESKISRIMNDTGLFEDDSWREKPAS